MPGSLLGLCEVLRWCSDAYSWRPKSGVPTRAKYSFQLSVANALLTPDSLVYSRNRRNLPNFVVFIYTCVSIGWEGIFL